MSCDKTKCCETKVAALNCCTDKKEFWNWWKTTDRTFSAEEVVSLLEKIKEFDAGAIDEYLTNHVDKSFDAWREGLK
jgi:hypothetical protein